MLYAIEMFPIIESIHDKSRQAVAINYVCNRYSVYDRPRVADEVASDYSLGHALAAIVTCDERILLKGLVRSKNVELAERLL